MLAIPCRLRSAHRAGNITFLPKTAKQTTAAITGASAPSPPRKANRRVGAEGCWRHRRRSQSHHPGARSARGALKEGLKLRILQAAVGGGQRLQPIRLIIANDSSIESIDALSDLGKYVSVDARNLGNTEVAQATRTAGRRQRRAALPEIYETALRNHLPRPVIEDMIRIYSYDIDFHRKVQPGDSFEVLFAGEEEETPGAEGQGRGDVRLADHRRAK